MMPKGKKEKGKDGKKDKEKEPKKLKSKVHNSSSVGNIFSFKKMGSSSSNLLGPKKSARGTPKNKTSPPGTPPSPHPSPNPPPKSSPQPPPKSSPQLDGTNDAKKSPQTTAKHNSGGGGGAGGEEPVHPALEPLKLKRLKLKGAMEDPLYSVVFENYVKEELQMENFLFWKATQVCFLSFFYVLRKKKLLFLFFSFLPPPSVLTLP